MADAHTQMMRSEVHSWRTRLETLPCWVILAVGFGVAMPAQAAAPARLLVTNAQLVTMAPTQREPFTGWMLADADGRIAMLGEGTPPSGVAATFTFDAAGKFVLPGFLSGHSHLMQSVERGLAANRDLLGWLEARQGHARGGCADGDLYAYVLHGALDYLRHGITSAYNYTARSARMTEAQYDEQFFAQLDSGQRFSFGLSLAGAETETAMRALFDRFLAVVTPHRRNPGFLRLSLGKAGSPGRGGEKVLPWEVAIAREHGLDVQMHYLEPLLTSDLQRAAFPAIVASGLLDVGVMYAHFIHPDDEIVATSGAKGARMIWNPLSNGRLASGLADIPKYRAAGIEVGMGIDGQASADVSDPFENMRMGLYQTRMRHQSASIMQPFDLLHLHTLGTARAMGVADKVGSLEPGKYADFIVVDPADFDVGPVFDTYATLVFSCSVANLEWVFVGGEPHVHRGELLRHNFPQLSRDIRARQEALAIRRQTVAAVQP